MRPKARMFAAKLDDPWKIPFIAAMLDVAFGCIVERC